MQTLQNISKRIFAAFIFFTRLPLWRVAVVEKRHFEGVVPLWPLVGWFTGGVMALVFWVCSLCQIPVNISVIVALLSRLLLTGALHEDGFADFCDGFGGGTDRGKILVIMKDSHIGTYGVIGLVLYFLLLWNVWVLIYQMGLSPLWMLAVDACCKYISSTIIYFLPYARKEQEAKNKLIYTATSVSEKVVSCLLGISPLIVVLVIDSCGIISIGTVVVSLMSSIGMCAILFYTMHCRIQGYTGDCCGATFIITELVFYVSLLVFTFYYTSYYTSIL